MPVDSKSPVVKKYGSLVGHFVQYGSYHSNPVNQWIHIVCVPLIFITALIFLSAAPLRLPALFAPFTGLVSKLSGILGVPLPLTYAIPATVAYMSFYLLIAPLKLGLPMAAIVAAEYVCASFYRASTFAVKSPYGMWAPVAVHVVAWILQFYGHGVHEKRSPALLDNLFQAIFMAPMFVFLEVLFKLGLLKDLQKAVEPVIRDEIKAFRAGKKATTTNAAAVANGEEPPSVSGRTRSRDKSA